MKTTTRKKAKKNELGKRVMQERKCFSYGENKFEVLTNKVINVEEKIEDKVKKNKKTILREERLKEERKTSGCEKNRICHGTLKPLYFILIFFSFYLFSLI